jgi:hypothetical protein
MTVSPDLTVSYTFYMNTNTDMDMDLDTVMARDMEMPWTYG